MTPVVTEKRRILLAGMEFFGDPYTTGGGWSESNAIGQLWKRFMGFYETGKTSIKQAVSESGYEVWIGVDGVTSKGKESIFVGVEVDGIEDLPLALVARSMPETRYAVFTLSGEQIKTDWSKIWSDWLPASGLTKTHDYLIEYYDVERFKGMHNPESQLDFMVPVE